MNKTTATSSNDKTKWKIETQHRASVYIWLLVKTHLHDNDLIIIFINAIFFFSNAS